MDGINGNFIIAIPEKEIWSNQSYKITNISKQLIGASLFRSKYNLPRVNASIGSNKDAEIFIALTERDNKSLGNALENATWRLRNEMYIEGTNNGKQVETLDNVWSKQINKGKRVPILLERKNGPTNPFMFINLVNLRESEDLVIAILIKRGRFYFINVLLLRNNLLIQFQLRTMNSNKKLF